MQVIRFEGKGDTTVIRRGEISDPLPDNDQALIEIKTFALNRADILQRKGLYPPPPGESDIPGLEAAGVVISAPAGSTFKKGDRVMTLLGSGGYAEKVAVSPLLMMPIPEVLSFEEAAAIPEAFLTAHHNLFTLGEIKVNGRALVHAGASGVGTAAIQLLKERQVQTFVTVGSDDKAVFCEKLGEGKVIAINYKNEDFSERIAAATNGQGVDVILDCIGGSYFEKNTKSLSLGGRLVSIGTMGGNKAELNFGLLLSRRIRVIGSTLRALPLPDKALIVKRFSETSLNHFPRRTYRPIIHQVFTSDSIVDAHHAMESNQNTGKIIVRW